MDQYTLLHEKISDVWEMVEEITSTIPGVQEMVDMKGIGDITIAAFLAEVGDLNNYDHPEQMIKLAGLNLKLATSGKWQGRTVITKRAAQSYAPCCTKLSCHWSIKKRKSVKEKAIVDSTML